jgi:hypothetical protein
MILDVPPPLDLVRESQVKRRRLGRRAAQDGRLVWSEVQYLCCIVKGGLNLSRYQKKYRPLGCWKSQLSMNNPILIKLLLLLVLLLF